MHHSVMSPIIRGLDWKVWHVQSLFCPSHVWVEQLTQNLLVSDNRSGLRSDSEGEVIESVTLVRTKVGMLKAVGEDRGHVPDRANEFLRVCIFSLKHVRNPFLVSGKNFRPWWRTSCSRRTDGFKGCSVQSCG